MKQEYSFILSLWLFVSLCSPVCQKEYLRLASFWKLVVAQDTDLGSIPAPGSMSQLAADVQAGVQVPSSLHWPAPLSPFSSLQLCAGWEWGSVTIATLFSTGLFILGSLKLYMRKGHWNWYYLTGFFFFFEGIKAVGIVLTLSVSCRILLFPQY